ncbi:hypothetical protein NDU88_003211 [Pleurodeles waltl]|uniref:Uncharacterized protein n=1 Tax=Pleurodeles waltl TaxID=8319 RepID=A0AAV7UXT0_PLEWA|nr:hypothetical protein NDU88_003211 [Pleurodeles waltl]
MRHGLVTAVEHRPSSVRFSRCSVVFLNALVGEQQQRQGRGTIKDWMRIIINLDEVKKTEQEATSYAYICWSGL